MCVYIWCVSAKLLFERCYLPKHVVRLGHLRYVPLRDVIVKRCRTLEHTTHTYVVRVCVSACVCVCVRARARVNAYIYIYVCVCVCVCE